MEFISDDIKLFQLLSNNIINLTINQLNRGIWSLIYIYKNNYPFLLVNYKEYNNITQLFHRFNNNKIFYFKYESLEECNICTPAMKKESWLNNIIMNDLNYLSLYNIEQLIYYNLKNDAYNCWYHDEKIINSNITNYYKTIIKVEVPNIIFIGFELSNENDLYNDVNSDNDENNINSVERLNLICFNRMKDNIKIIKDKIVAKFSVYNFKFSLKAIICSPFSGHYCEILINLEKDENILKKKKIIFMTIWRTIIIL